MIAKIPALAKDAIDFFNIVFLIAIARPQAGMPVF